MKLLRRIFDPVDHGAYISATMLQVAPTYAANADMSSAAMNGMMHEQDGQGDKMPCKGMLPNCVTDIGCIFLVSVPTPNLTLVTMTAWSSVIYDNAFEGSRGRTIKPALDLPSPSPEPERADLCRHPPFSLDDSVSDASARVPPMPELTG